MKEIPLTKGKFTTVDDETFEVLVKFKWHCVKGYAVRNHYIGVAKIGAVRLEVIKMHRQITNCPKELQVDHINGNKLDNRKENLRVCTSRENTINSKIRSDSTTGFKGVTKKKWGTKGQFKYCARITVEGGKRVHLGYFNKAEDAAKAYDKAAKELHGEFARLNFT